MTDYEGEKAMEIEALEAILMDDMQLAAPEQRPEGWPEGPIYAITIAPKDADEEEPTDIPVRLALLFSHTPKYPDEPCRVRVRSLRGISPADLDEAQTALEAQAHANVGMAMVFTLAQWAKDWLRAKVRPGECDAPLDAAELAATAIAAEERRLAELRAAGTPVTKATFTAWAMEYEADLALAKAQLAGAAGVTASKRLSGRAYFESGGQAALKEMMAGVGGDDDEDAFDDDGADGANGEEDELIALFLQKRRQAAESGVAAVDEGGGGRRPGARGDGGGDDDDDDDDESDYVPGEDDDDEEEDDDEDDT